MTLFIFILLAALYSAFITKMAWAHDYDHNGVGCVLWSVVGVPIVVFLTIFIDEFINKF